MTCNLKVAYNALMATNDDKVFKALADASRRELLDRLRKKNERLEAELKKTRTALDIVGKAHALLELFSESADSERKPRK